MSLILNITYNKYIISLENLRVLIVSRSECMERATFFSDTCIVKIYIVKMQEIICPITTYQSNA